MCSFNVLQLCVSSCGAQTPWSVGHMCWQGEEVFSLTGRVCVISVRGTFSLSSRLMARASCSCSSSSPVVAGRACSRSGASRGEEVEAAGTQMQRRFFRERCGARHKWGGKDLQMGGNGRKRFRLNIKVRNELVLFFEC